MALKIDAEHFELIRAYGEEAYPNECCGFLLGRQINSDKEVIWTLPVQNERERREQYHRFLITPDTYLQGEKFARQRDLEIIGFFHSHPNAEARPSGYDLEHGWPWYSYIILAVRNQQAAEMTSWVLEEDRSKFTEEAIIVKPK